jgi:hypothetical protein
MKYSKAEVHCKTHGVSALRLKTPWSMRTLGLRRLTYVATLSGIAEGRRRESAKRLQGLVQEGVLTRLVALGLARDTRLRWLGDRRSHRPSASVRWSPAREPLEPQ